MTPGMEWLLIAWGVVTGILLILLFYRSTLTRQEDDRLFIDESSSSRATEQSQLIAKVNKINPLVKTGRRNFGPDDLGNRGMGGLPWTELGTTVKPKRCKNRTIVQQRKPLREIDNHQCFSKQKPAP